MGIYTDLLDLALNARNLWPEDIFLRLYLFLQRRLFLNFGSLFLKTDGF